MKINKMKAAIGVLATSAVVSLVGSISGTMAWLQYNTRARVEMHGTTASCTENLQIRTITGWNTTSANPAEKMVATNSAAEALSAAAYNGKTVITGEGKYYTSDGSAWTGTALSGGEKYTVAGETYVWNATAAKWKGSYSGYGDWKSALTKDDIAASATGLGHNLSEEKFKPVTNPGIAATDPLGKFYSHPLCGHEHYTGGTTGNWKEAKADEFIQFAVQFRVLDVDDDMDNTTLAKDLFLTDLVVADDGSGLDVSSALRFHVRNVTSASNKLFGLGKASTDVSFTTVTHGNLDLDADGDMDTIADVPHNYSWTAGSDTLLDYGAADSNQVYYNALQEDAEHVKQVLATVDNYGKLTGGTSIGTTVAGSTAGSDVVADADHLTFIVTMWLEGWHAFERNTADFKKGEYTTGDTASRPATPSADQLYYDTTLSKMIRWDASLGTPAWVDYNLSNGFYYLETVSGKYHKATSKTALDVAEVGTTFESPMWDASDVIGAAFNIGFSFGVPALSPIQD